MSKSDIPAMFYRVKRVLADCFPGAEVEHSYVPESPENYGGHTASVRDDRFSVVAGVRKDFAVVLSVFYVGYAYKVTSSALSDPSSKEIRKCLVELCTESFRKYCLDQ